MKNLAKMLCLTLLFASSMSMADSFYIKTQDLNVKDYSEKCGEQCPEIDYSLLDTGNSWLDNIINKDIIGNIAMHEYEEGSSEDKRWKAFFDNQNPTKAGLTNQLNLAIDSVVKANAEWLKDSESSLTYSSYSQPKYEGHKTLKNGDRLELFSISTEHYTGGAHGMYWVHQYVFNMASKKQLSLDDIIIHGKKSALEKLAKRKYHEYLKEHEIDPKEHSEFWKFFLTDNFSFDDKGLVLLYQPYEITPYVMGGPELQIRYAELSGIIKAEYL